MRAPLRITELLCVISPLLWSSCGAGEVSPPEDPAGESGAIPASWQAILAELVAGADSPPIPERSLTERQRSLYLAIRRSRTMLSLDPSDQARRRELAELWLQASHPALALSEIGWALKRDPLDAASLALAAHALEGIQRIASSRTLWRRVLALEPDSDEAHWCLARISERAGDSAEALEVALEGSRIAPNHAELALLAGRLSLDAGQLGDADRLLERAVANDPASQEVRFARMRLLRELGREREAQAEQAEHERLARLDDLGLPADTAPLERRLALALAWIADGELQLAETELRALLAASYHPSAVEALRALLEDDGREARAELGALERDHPHLAGKLLEP